MKVDLGNIAPRVEDVGTLSPLVFGLGALRPPIVESLGLLGPNIVGLGELQPTLFNLGLSQFPFLIDPNVLNVYTFRRYLFDEGSGLVMVDDTGNQDGDYINPYSYDDRTELEGAEGLVYFPYTSSMVDSKTVLDFDGDYTLSIFYAKVTTSNRLLASATNPASGYDKPYVVAVTWSTAYMYRAYDAAGVNVVNLFDTSFGAPANYRWVRATWRNTAGVVEFFLDGEKSTMSATQTGPIACLHDFLIADYGGGGLSTNSPRVAFMGMEESALSDAEIIASHLMGDKRDWWRDNIVGNGFKPDVHSALLKEEIGGLIAHEESQNGNGNGTYSLDFGVPGYSVLYEPCFPGEYNAKRYISAALQRIDHPVYNFSNSWTFVFSGYDETAPWWSWDCGFGYVGSTAYFRLLNFSNAYRRLQLNDGTTTHSGPALPVWSAGDGPIRWAIRWDWTADEVHVFMLIGETLTKTATWDVSGIDPADLDSDQSMRFGYYEGGYAPNYSQVIGPSVLFTSALSDSDIELIMGAEL